MTKNDYLAKLMNELKKNAVADASDIVSEYEQHFAFKMADGFSEDEISAKLGDPIEVAAQFERRNDAEAFSGKKATTIVGLVFADIFVGMFFILLFVWEAIMAAFSLVSATIAVSLIGGFNIYALIPPIPYGCGVIFALSLAALAVLASTGCIYFAAFIRQLIRSYGRFHHNAIASASGNAVLPSLAIHPQLTARTNRRIRTVALFSLSIFAACFVLAMVVSMVSSGVFEFWHAWGWFGYDGPLYKGGAL